MLTHAYVQCVPVGGLWRILAKLAVGGFWRILAKLAVGGFWHILAELAVAGFWRNLAKLPVGGFWWILVDFSQTCIWRVWIKSAVMNLKKRMANDFANPDPNTNKFSSSCSKFPENGIIIEN